MLSAYRNIMRVSHTWRATVSSNTLEERLYIRNEARTLFRKNKDVSQVHTYTLLIPRVHEKMFY